MSTNNDRNDVQDLLDDNRVQGLDIELDTDIVSLQDRQELQHEIMEQSDTDTYLLIFNDGDWTIDDLRATDRNPHIEVEYDLGYEHDQLDAIYIMRIMELYLNDVIETVGKYRYWQDTGEHSREEIDSLWRDHLIQ